MVIMKRIIFIPILIPLLLARLIMKLVLIAEGWVAGVVFLLLAIMALVALLNKIWMGLAVAACLFVAVIVILHVTVLLGIYIELALDLFR